MLTKILPALKRVGGFPTRLAETVKCPDCGQEHVIRKDIRDNFKQITVKCGCGTSMEVYKGVSWLIKKVTKRNDFPS